MTLKQLTKKILKQYRIKIPVHYSTDFYVEYKNEKMRALYVPHPSYRPQSINELKVHVACVKFTENLIKENNLSADYYTFAIYHEIGHIICGVNNFKQYENDQNVLAQLINEGKIDENQYIFLYNILENEQIANNWAINELKKNTI